MLRRITVKKLYNLYDYDIDMGLGNGPIHFITAPNGYGKTTILEMVNAVLTSQYGILENIPFEDMSLFFDDDTELRVEQVRHYAVVEDSLDVQNKPKVDLIFRLIKNDVELKEMGNLEMFLVSKTCHYLTDTRLLKKKTDTERMADDLDAINLNVYAEILKRILNDPVLSDQYAGRIDVFKKIVGRSDFASKTLEITKIFGFRFIADDADKTKIPLNSLSSGEKHLIIQVFELLFNAQQDTLVLIDEPELSLHMMWQMNYFKNIQEIAKIRGFQYLIATHSPQIFNNMWSLTTDLYTNSFGVE